MTTLIDENDFLVFDPKSASIVLSVGNGILSKSKKIVASLTNALILFSDKVINQEISFIRFQNHRMVFIHEKDLFGVKLVPKDQLTKNFVPSIKIMLNIENQLRNLDKSFQESSEQTIMNLYELLRDPVQNLYVFPDSIEGYLALLTIMATLNYDLFVNLDSVKRNFLIVKSDQIVNDLPNPINGIFNFGVAPNQLKFSKESKQTIFIDLKDSIFTSIFPNNKTLYSLISQIIGKESSSFIIAQIMNKEQSINEVALSLVKLPDYNLAVDIAIEAIANFSKEQRLAKPLYRIIIKKLKDLEGKPGFELPIEEAQNDEEIPNQVKSKPFITSSPEIKPQEISSKLGPTTIKSEEPVLLQKTMNTAELTSLANEFTSKLENLTKTETIEPQLNQNIVIESKKEYSESKIVDKDPSKLKIDKNHIFMENFKVYLDFTPFRLGSKPENIFYRPSIQLVRINNEKTQVNIKIEPAKHKWLFDIFSDLKATIPINFTGEEGNFEVFTSNDFLSDVLRVAIWASIIEITYAIQHGEFELPDIFNIHNKSSLCLILDLPPERKKQLPSQIEEIIEEDKLIKGSGVEDLVNSLDSTFVSISHALKTKKGVGFVLRKNSKELPLILEFILTLAEITGMGWSRW